MTKEKAVAIAEFKEVTTTDLETVKDMVAKGATNSELKYFATFCNQVKLNPLAKQIHFVKRGNSATIQTSIDGLRVIAERSGKYEGQTEVEYGPIIEVKTKVSVWNNGNKETKQVTIKVPEWAKIGIYRSDFREPLFVTAYFKEFCPKAPNNHMWIKMPRVMLAKVAEAQALRKAFPNDMAGLYADEELQQADSGKENVTNAPKSYTPSEAKRTSKKVTKKTVTKKATKQESKIEEGEVIDPEQIEKEMEQSKKFDLLVQAVEQGKAEDWSKEIWEKSLKYFTGTPFEADFIDLCSDLYKPTKTKKNGK